ncbi:hypothetical protein NEIMUCOT_04788 [Neisseria mucosa ATCC 25996]|uniref:Uncharacterized protein n=1 Tax=Neisseria mucosa (strain ATCC 25996 / DSM 4631 / NCTC 10774 / M26) TaxID=546266 RepID=D2ZVZ5_NEIM2|nr:hypothetical protein NEIMUCOT_04788 [Neisseria mucosa ATCC 25996]
MSAASSPCPDLNLIHYTTTTKTGPTPTQPTKPLSPKSTNGIKDATGKGALPQHWVGTAKKWRG